MPSETRFTNEGQLKEGKAGYSFFWSGRNSEDRWEAGVGFAAKTNLISTLTNLPNGIKVAPWLLGFLSEETLCHPNKWICSHNDKSRGDQRQMLQGLRKHTRTWRRPRIQSKFDNQPRLKNFNLNLILTCNIHIPQVAQLLLSCYIQPKSQRVGPAHSKAKN